MLQIEAKVKELQPQFETIVQKTKEAYDSLTKNTTAASSK